MCGMEKHIYVTTRKLIHQASDMLILPAQIITQDIILCDTRLCSHHQRFYVHRSTHSGVD